MRWLLLVLLISLVGLLVAALGLARFIWRQRARRGSKPSTADAQVSEQPNGNDVKTRR
jgi:uncharacterized membrane protein YidH (DUF202 family)